MILPPATLVVWKDWQGDHMGKWITSFRELDVYKRAFELAMTIFEHTKAFPREEQYSLTSQIRRSSRAVTANLAEAWAKRRYEAHWISKLSDCQAEAMETQGWFLYAKNCGFLGPAVADQLIQDYDSIIAAFNRMIEQAADWTVK